MEAKLAQEEQMKQDRSLLGLGFKGSKGSKGSKGLGFNRGWRVRLFACEPRGSWKYSAGSHKKKEKLAKKAMEQLLREEDVLGGFGASRLQSGADVLARSLSVANFRAKVSEQRATSHSSCCL